MSGQNRYIVTVGVDSAEVELSERGEIAVVRFKGHGQQARSEEAGRAICAILKEEGVPLQGIQMFTLHEAGEPGTLIASGHPILTGARVAWWPLFRADSEATSFRSLESRGSLVEALDAVFARLKAVLALPHKP